MARKQEPMTFSGALEPLAQKPLDGRRKVNLISDLTEAASFPYIYKGLDVFCDENEKWYTFLGGDQTDIANWREEGSAKDPGFFVVDTTTTYTYVQLKAIVQTGRAVVTHEGQANVVISHDCVDDNLEGQNYIVLTVIKNIYSGGVPPVVLHYEWWGEIGGEFSFTSTRQSRVENVSNSFNGGSPSDLLTKSAIAAELNKKQDKLESGVNIKTINGQPIMGEGDLEIGGGTGETPTLDAVLKKGNSTERSARFTDELNGRQVEVGAGGTYMTGIGTEGMRQFYVSQNGIRAVDNLVGTITPKFVVPFEPSGEDQVAMSDAVKASFKKALGIANDAFVFDVDSDQFTPDPDNPDGKHYGVTITSPTYDELLALLQTDTFVYARLLYNNGKAYEIMQLFHNMNSIYGRYFDVEFPQKRLQFASAYVNKRNNNTYFGTYQDYIGGSGDSVVTLYDVSNMPSAPTVMSDMQNNRLCYIDGHWLVTGYDKKQVSSGKFIIYADYNDERVTYVFAIQGENLTSVISRTVSKKPEFGISIEVGVEKWQGTYTDETGTVYQVYSKMIFIPALPATAGIEGYPHGITGIKQILQVYGFTTDGFVLNTPRQNIQDSIGIYQVQKAGNIQIEVGKDRSSKAAYVCLVYAKNNS